MEEVLEIVVIKIKVELLKLVVEEVDDFNEEFILKKGIKRKFDVFEKEEFLSLDLSEEDELEDEGEKVVVSGVIDIEDDEFMG